MCAQFAPSSVFRHGGSKMPCHHLVRIRSARHLKIPYFVPSISLISSSTSSIVRGAATAPSPSKSSSSCEEEEEDDGLPLGPEPGTATTSFSSFKTEVDAPRIAALDAEFYMDPLSPLYTFEIELKRPLGLCRIGRYEDALRLYERQYNEVLQMHRRRWVEDALPWVYFDRASCEHEYKKMRNFACINLFLTLFSIGVILVIEVFAANILPESWQKKPYDIIIVEVLFYIYILFYIYYLLNFQKRFRFWRAIELRYWRPMGPKTRARLEAESRLGRSIALKAWRPAGDKPESPKR